MTKQEQREHRRLLARWAVGKATKAEILRCIELDRRARWIAERKTDWALARAEGKA